MILLIYDNCISTYIDYNISIISPFVLIILRFILPLVDNWLGLDCGDALLGENKP